VTFDEIILSNNQFLRKNHHDHLTISTYETQIYLQFRLLEDHSNVALCLFRTIEKHAVDNTNSNSDTKIRLYPGVKFQNQ
jgi:hypothetical protein